MKKFALGFLVALSSGCELQPAVFTSEDAVSDRGELFCLDQGVNEFDMVVRDGDYLLFSHEFDTANTIVRRSPTVEGLANAKPVPVIPGRFPTVIEVDGRWHAWAYDAQVGKTDHYVADKWDGPYVRKDDVGLRAADWHVRRNPDDGFYYATYKSIDNLYAGIARAPDPAGPWQDFGGIFDHLPRAGWHDFEEADPAIFFYKGRAFVLFAGWNSRSGRPDGGLQRIGVVELDMQRLRAKDQAVVLLEPRQAWQRRGGSTKVFNPVFMETPQGPRIFYSHNPSARDICAGFGVADVVK
ncbi:hypothetical protein [Pseudomonas sp. BN102]|uniref:hypothetical protein n=1 Tax=Pseudomonas sp. BN102 TaxID=2567886 RepID=UPI0024586BFA|nr:hypothetical protein [Pseudomonas sp. BN102]MDH4607203.1 hypothetical protein [Pseudomonas sp. BN102]